MKRLALATLALLTFGLANTAWSVTIHDEGVDGDLSTDPASPTALAFGLGSNVVTGSVVSPGDTRDVWTFNVAPGNVLSAIIIDVAPGNRSYSTIVGGTTSAVPGGGNINFFLGGAHVDPINQGDDLLAILSAGIGSGFTGSLPAGDYSFLFQQTGPQVNGYSLDFQVSVIPIPPALALFASALGLLGWVRRRA